MSQLNDKLNAWVGTDGIDYTDTEIGIAHCFKWLVPKLNEPVIQFRTHFNNSKWYAYIKIDCSPWESEGYGETPALALCLALGKLYSGTKGEEKE